MRASSLALALALVVLAVAAADTAHDTAAWTPTLLRGRRLAADTPARLTGKLVGSGAAGLRLLAVNSQGQATVVPLSDGAFSAALPAGGAYTLTLITSAGRLLGPVVCASQAGGTRAVMTFKAVGDAGSITVDAAKGYAYRTGAGSGPCETNPSKGAIVVPASRGVPRGVGNLGRKPASNGTSGAARPGGDLDLDGLVGAFDVDDNGNSILDSYDLTEARPVLGADFWVFSNTKVDMGDTINYYTGRYPGPAADAIFQRAITLAIQVPRTSRGVRVTSVRLDCFGLTYCSPGGTGRAVVGPGTTKAFPDDPVFAYNAAAGGGRIKAGPTRDFQLQAQAAPTAIRSGDAMAETLQLASGARVTLPGIVNFVYKSTPALVRITIDGTTHTVSYPVNASSKGTYANPFKVPLMGPVVVDMVLYRPQREAMMGEPSPTGFIDLGNMEWQSWAPNVPGGVMGQCRGITMSSSDPDLRRSAGGFYDKRPDTATVLAGPKPTVSLTLNLTQCLDLGPPPTGSPTTGPGPGWPNFSNETYCFAVGPRSAFNDNTEVKYCFSREPVLRPVGPGPFGPAPGPTAPGP